MDDVKMAPTERKRKNLARSRSRNAPKRVVGLSKSDVVSIVKSQSEKKILRIEGLEQAIISSTACFVYELSQIAEGTGDNERVGSKVSPVNLRMKYILHNNGAVTQYVRMAIISCNGGAFNSNAARMVINPGTGTPAQLTAEVLTNMTDDLNKQEFSIVYDRVHRVAGLGDGTGIETIFKDVNLKIPKKKRSFESFYNPDSNHGNLRLFVWNVSADADTLAQTIELTFHSAYAYNDF